jgi:hypothetical protein
MCTSEQNASTETYPFNNIIRKVFCKKVFVIKANLKERIQFKQCPLTKVAGLPLYSKLSIHTENPQFTLLGFKSVRAFLHLPGL